MKHKYPTIQSTGSDSNKGQRKLLRIAVIGCGRVASHHLRFISQTPGTRIVGLADQNEQFARELGQLYRVDEVHNSLEKMLESTAVDVLHVLTPPSHHYSQALAAIERDVHVIVEKPVTFRASETEHLYRQAAARGVLLCPDFIQLFHPAFLKARDIVESGEIGQVVSVESSLSESLDIPELRESRRLHWSFELPGGVLHNIITHPLYLALYFLGVPRSLTVIPRSLGAIAQGVTDHLEVLIDTAQGSAHVVVSHATSSRPTYFVNVFCEKGVVSVNFDTSTVLVTRPGMMPRSVERGTSNFFQAGQLCGSGIRNIVDFLRGRLVPYQGLQELIPRFYAAVRDGTAPPVSSELTKAVVRAEEEILSRAGKLHLDLGRRPSHQMTDRHRERVLVTGAAGYLGTAVVRLLVEEGYTVRAMVRPLSHIGLLEELGIEISFGDVRDLLSLVQAVEGMDIVVHAAAGLRGSAKHILDSCMIGTQNLAEATRKAGVRRVIYLSSMSIYDYSQLKDGSVITEHTALDDHPQFRGAYSIAKRKAEDVALTHLKHERPSWTILRPSIIVGRNKDLFEAISGFRLGSVFICLSSSGRNLCLIHVEDVAAIIVRLLRNDATQGRIFVVSDPEKLQLEEYIRVLIRDSNSHRKTRVLHVPYWFAKVGVASFMALRKLTGRGPSLNFRQLITLYRNFGVSTDALKSELDWRPPQNLLERLRAERLADK